MSLVNLLTHLAGSVVSHVASDVRNSTDDAHTYRKSQVPHVQPIVDTGESAVQTQRHDRE